MELNEVVNDFAYDGEIEYYVYNNRLAMQIYVGVED